MRRFVMIAVVTLGLFVPGTGGGGAVAAGDAGVALRAQPEAGFLAASRLVVGQIYLTALGEPGTVVSFAEVINGVAQPLTQATIGPSTALAVRSATWRCDRLVRSFAAIATAPDGSVRSATYDLRTPSCANRLTIIAPRRVARSALLRVRVVDRWALGTPVQLCVSGAALPRRCRGLRVPPSAAGVTRRFRPRRSGYVRVATAVSGSKVVGSVAVGTAEARATRTGPVLLTTGDSTIEGIDSVLGDGLGTAASVTSQSFPGTGLSGRGIQEWRRFSRAQVQGLRPRVTVVSIGANEGFPVTVGPSAAPVACCGDAWIVGMAQRQRELMLTYVRQGAGRVAWLTLPVPRREDRARITAAVNRALVLAAHGLPAVRIVDLGAVFTPAGAFRESILHGGQPVRVRADDGIHLTAAGSAIAADVIQAEIERLGWLDDV